tara:strand:- start:25 stop:1134 length:1110 start_codon:yes stop_codon:yes gene_type:complete
MKIFIINTDYYSLESFYKQNSSIESLAFKEQYNLRMESFIGTADFYSTNLRQLGHEAWDVVANLEPLQKKWIKEQGIRVNDYGWNVRLRKGFFPWIYKKKKDWFYSILKAQIKNFRPDIIYSCAIESIGSDFLNSVKDYYGFAIGQHAASLNHKDISGYDLILSSLPNQVDYFKNQGINSRLFNLGFESKILKHLKKDSKKHDIVFVGGFGKNFKNSTELIEKIVKKFDFKLWGYGVENLSKESIIRQNLNGVLYGKEMYQTLMDSKIIFNRHADFAGSFANNMRLYQSTGVGSLLLTDKKRNLSNIFHENKELCTYSNVDDCLEKIEYYLDNEEDREKIAYAGQARCLDEHTWYNRMEELLSIIKNIL